ncbi:unnamed protein product [Cylindrotheca closterium]|uniref:Arb2 domain-containing protein n=1 Tax=Cylindrotheca closterium TaxID=2856 RepID=A0AAD2CG85_9STRA|nr:unnamed protein product [Cylindrotheca closterium]
MGNALFCPQLHQDGIDCVSGAGFVFMRHPPLLETFNLDDLDAHGVQGTLATKGSRVDVPSRKKDLAHYGFDYRFTDPTYEKEARTWTGKKSSTDTDVSSSNEFDFTTRLYHTKSNDMITKDNFRKFRLHGKLFDDVTDCCQEIVQQGLQDVYRYDVVTIPVSSQSSVSGGDATPPIQAFVSPDLAERLSIDEDVEPRKASTKEEKPVLLIICGKGQSRAGVLSTKQLVLSGLESGSAVYHILQAEEQQMSVIILDPNAWGERRGMDVVNHSLTYFFGETTTDTKEGTRISASARLSKCPLYIIAHSAAGGYLTRYLSQGVARETLLRQINRVAFTDSTHNLQWYNKDQRLWVYLQSSKCLYIRNNSAPRPFGNHHAKKAGEKHEGDHWWHHRFGNIPTVWAGTPEHSLMCWTARHVIWDFFTEKTKKTA